MIRNSFLIFLGLTLNSYLFSSCKEKNEYDLRVRNIIKFLKDDKRIEMDSCHVVFLLQANKCSVCTQENLEMIFKEIQKEGITNSLFILNGFNDSILDFLLKKNSIEHFRIIIDENNLLKKYGLSFMKNLRINTCNRKVISWKFYD